MKCFNFNSCDIDSDAAKDIEYTLNVKVWVHGWGLKPRLQKKMCEQLNKDDWTVLETFTTVCEITSLTVFISTLIHFCLTGVSKSDPHGS